MLIRLGRQRAVILNRACGAVRLEPDLDDVEVVLAEHQTGVVDLRPPAGCPVRQQQRLRRPGDRVVQRGDLVEQRLSTGRIELASCSAGARTMETSPLRVIGTQLRKSRRTSSAKYGLSVTSPTDSIP